MPQDARRNQLISMFRSEPARALDSIVTRGRAIMTQEDFATFRAAVLDDLGLSVIPEDTPPEHEAGFVAIGKILAQHTDNAPELMEGIAEEVDWKGEETPET